MSPVCSSIHFLKVTFNGWEWTVLDNFQTCRDSVVPCVYWLKEEGKSDGDSNNFSTVYSKQPNLTICKPWTIFWFKTFKGWDGATCDWQTALANAHLQVVWIFSNFIQLQTDICKLLIYVTLFCDIFQAFAYTCWVLFLLWIFCWSLLTTMRCAMCDEHLLKGDDVFRKRRERRQKMKMWTSVLGL